MIRVLTMYDTNINSVASILKAWGWFLWFWSGPQSRPLQLVCIYTKFQILTQIHQYWRHEGDFYDFGAGSINIVSYGTIWCCIVNMGIYGSFSYLPLIVEYLWYIESRDLFGRMLGYNEVVDIFSYIGHLGLLFKSVKEEK